MDAALDIDGLMEGVALAIKGAVDRATAPLLARIAALESREPVVVEKMIAEPPSIDEFRHEFGAFMAESRASVAEQRAADAELRAQMPDAAELRRASETAALESRAAIGDLKGQVADLAMQLRERADADTARVAAALALVKDGHTPTDNELAPAIDKAVARRFEAAPEPLSEETVIALIDASLDDRLPDITRKAAGIVPAAEPPTLPDVPALISAEMDRRESGIAEKAASLVPEPDIGGAVAEEMDRRLPGAVAAALMDKAEVIAKLAAPLVNVPKAPELPDIPALVDSAVGAEVGRRLGDIAKQAADMVPPPDPPELPDILALVKGEIAEATTGLATMPHVREEIAKATTDLRGELAPHSETEIRSIARDAAKEEIAIQPPSLMLDQIEPLIDRAVAPLREAIDALPKPLSPEELSRSAAEKAAAVLEPDIAALGKRIDDLPVGVGVADVERIAAEKAAAIRQELAAEMPTDQDIRDAARAEMDGREGSIAEKAAALVVVPAVKALTAEDVRPVVREEVKSAIDALPPAEPGKPGEPPDPEALAEMVAEAVADQLVGKGIADALIDRDGELVLTFDDGRTKSVGLVVGKDVDMGSISTQIADLYAAVPKPKDGEDGIGFDDLTIESDGERTFTLRATCGERTKQCSIELPIVIDRGIWSAGWYKRGDGVTFAGSFFIAQKDTDAKPETSADWRLAVKRGRDGKDAPLPKTIIVPAKTED